MSGIYFTLLALLTSIFAFLIIKTVLKTESPHDPIAYAAISFFLGGIYAAIIYFCTSFHAQDFTSLLHPHTLLLVLLDITAWALGSYFYYPAFKHLPVSETTIIYSLEGLFALVIGAVLFKTDTFHLLRLLGSILIILSVALVTQEKGRWKFNKFSLLLILSTLIFGFATVVDNTIISHKYFSSVFFFLILNFGITSFVMLLFKPQTVKRLKSVYNDKKAMLTVMISSLATFLTFVLVYSAYKRNIVASQASLILSSQTVIVVVLGTFFFEEKDHLIKKILAGLIAVIGVYLIS